MLRYNKNQHRSPIGGHHFSDHGVMFRGDTFDEVVEKIRNFRITNALPLGEPSQDVLRFYAKNFPYMVVADGAETKEEGDAKRNSWRSWVFETWRNPPKKVIVTKDAERRWEICKKCPYNRSIENYKNSEDKEIRKRAYLLRKGIDIPSGLGFCSLHKADLSVFTFIEDAKAHSHAKDGDKHEKCWVS